MNRNIKRTISAFILLLAVILAANITTFIRVGVDGHYKEIRMPLYVKWTQFLARHYEYKRLSREITTGCKTDEEKVLAILKWTRENLKDVPPGMPVHDDHISNIIIRGYAVSEQFQDVFTAICSYSKIPAYWIKPYDRNHKAKYAVSLVRLNGNWRVFDAYHGFYFRNWSGNIASIDDIVMDPSIVKGRNVEMLTVNGVPYKDFFYNLSVITKPAIIRPYRQMPLPRLVYEVRKLMRIDKEEVN